MVENGGSLASGRSTNTPCVAACAGDGRLSQARELLHVGPRGDVRAEADGGLGAARSGEADGGRWRL
eukprot:4814100-Lingulodinium_polyedra.AAC.1